MENGALSELMDEVNFEIDRSSGRCGKGLCIVTSLFVVLSSISLVLTLAFSLISAIFGSGDLARVVQWTYISIFVSLFLFSATIYVIRLTQMVAMIDKRPEALEEALKVLESYE